MTGHLGQDKKMTDQLRQDTKNDRPTWSRQKMSDQLGQDKNTRPTWSRQKHS